MWGCPARAKWTALDFVDEAVQQGADLLLDTEVMGEGTIHKTLTRQDEEKLNEAHEINKRILEAAGADPKSIFRGAYESGHPCCTAAIGEVVDENQQTRLAGLYVSDPDRVAQRGGAWLRLAIMNSGSGHTQSLSDNASVYRDRSWDVQ